MNDLVRVDDKGRVRTIALNRPDKMNALTHELAWTVVGSEDAAEARRAFCDTRAPLFKGR
jgi:enoyl-CoA hydratase/carnithine racemase